MWPQGCAEPVTLIENLVRQRAAIGSVRLFLLLSFTELLRPEHADHFDFEGLGGLGTTSRLSRAGVLDPNPMHLSDLCLRLSTGSFPVDVAFVQLAGPDANGEYSPGVDHSYTHDLIAKARVVIAEVNSRAPVTTGVRPIRADELDVVVPSARPLPRMPVMEPDDDDRRLAAHVAGFITDRATIEIGVGTLPSALLPTLSDRCDLGVHTGLISDSVLNLIASGAVTNKYKPVDTGLSTGSAIFGTSPQAVDPRGLDIIMRPSRQVLDLPTLAGIPRFTAINTAVEVDLTGQVNAEYASGRYVGAVGGLVDFMRGAKASPGGRSIIALRSRTPRGTPRLVTRLAGGIVTVARSDVDVVVTEWGAAELAGKSVEDRVSSLIAIAHPDDRDSLMTEWATRPGV
ncbi:acetyl-CoA hydrolase/transferase family protein [Amycolatopsis deserti]|nr:acetyl-CoA hydrolase/transferase C-terminal domain-containing protein [Amycolatopsis deserti]